PLRRSSDLERPNIVDRLINGEVSLVINTPLGKKSFFDDAYIRRAALQYGIPCLTTLTAATAAVHGVRSLRVGMRTIVSLQEQHASLVMPSVARDLEGRAARYTS